jgi:ABC-type dipeptide/oligopeptide/nickel transport system permease component
VTDALASSRAAEGRSAEVARHRRRRQSRLILSKLFGAIVVVWGVVTITFFISRVVSPNPTALLVPPEASAGERQQVARALGLSAPLIDQYGRFLDQLLHGNLGTSFVTGQPVTSDLARRLPATLELGIVALICGVTIGVLLGVLSAIRAGSIFDHVVRGSIVAGLSMPQFWSGLTLISIFFIHLKVLPGPIGELPASVQPPRGITHMYLVDALMTGDWTALVEGVRQIILPAITLGFGIFSPIARVARTAMVQALESDYVRTARSLGFSPSRIYITFALKTALLPILTMTANAFAFALSGAVLVEGVFAWPGIGQYALNAIRQSDFPALQGFVIYVAMLYVLIYFVTDVLYAFADPRMKA